MHENPALTSSERAMKNLSSALRDIAGAAQQTVADSPSDEKVKTSPMYALFQGAEALDAAAHVADVLNYAERSFLSSCDHTLAFAQLIRTPTPPGPALVTVARGAIEAAARSWWLIQDGMLEELLHRILLMKIDDLVYPQKHPGSLVSSSDGSDLDIPKAQQLAKQELARLNLPPRKGISMKQMVGDMLAAVAPSTEAERTYSLYSSIAHSHLHGLNVFLTSPEGSSSPARSVSLPFVSAISQQLILVTNGVCINFKRWTGGSQIDLPRIDASSIRVSRILRSLPSEAFADQE